MDPKNPWNLALANGEALLVDCQGDKLLKVGLDSLAILLGKAARAAQDQPIVEGKELQSDDAGVVKTR